ncbi:uncharacterized protein EAE98_010827 [Botrytis deweyae]|uniref:Uncharacterized protein n=1 Tax=Botrytis deweyae TaxID=2478750 RepID=A0ABQ7I7T2_9HELO|nr:uncharacterized protein EAE98_010827 [Botrytis deweyae]KAF7916242.1 hypothetical protein EAE98_010827 [Botrytis deweyae]
MRSKHDQYHEYDEERKRHMKEFREHYKSYYRDDPTTENSKKLQRLAIKWTNDALTVAEARLQFLTENPSAYKDHTSVKGHLDQIQNAILSATTALERQRRTKASIGSIR